MVTVLVVLGPNNLEVPCRVFRDEKEGRDFCEKELGLLPRKINGNTIRYDLNITEKLAERLFVYYNSSSGKPHGLILAKLPYNKKFLAWS